ncbi:MAG: hypothetical protein K1X57_13230 [Gemmataceae bacterium]|nr:hypothetical protein [Gemmataceae bacterium]
MNWQLPLVVTCVTLAAGYLAWRAAKRSSCGNCGTGCGCGDTPAGPKLIPPEDLVRNLTKKK